MLKKIETKLAKMDRSHQKRLVNQCTRWYRSGEISGDDFVKLVKEATEEISKDNKTIYSNM